MVLAGFVQNLMFQHPCGGPATFQLDEFAIINGFSANSQQNATNMRVHIYA
jgi:hypothetical protein